MSMALALHSLGLRSQKSHCFSTPRMASAGSPMVSMANTIPSSSKLRRAGDPLQYSMKFAG